MGTIFNADEVLSMAETIERNGQEFYMKASQIVDDYEMSKLLSDLAEWEKGHESLFKDMRSQLTEEEKTPTAFDPYDESALYLNAMADDHIFIRGAFDTASILAGIEDPEDIINLAMNFEKDSILFFMGLQRIVPKRFGTEKVQKVIDEEVAHMAYLEKMRKKLRTD